ncbi:hypothetical protein JYQ62_14545 [Nostoc sp. UHCC 0702]|nr:hypothetical protein JYQ62_14545 [Nostoc sp. UHCC 0702]
MPISEIFSYYASQLILPPKFIGKTTSLVGLLEAGAAVALWMLVAKSTLEPELRNFHYADLPSV